STGATRTPRRFGTSTSPPARPPSPHSPHSPPRAPSADFSIRLTATLRRRSSWRTNSSKRGTPPRRRRTTPAGRYRGRRGMRTDRRKVEHGYRPSRLAPAPRKPQGPPSVALTPELKARALALFAEGRPVREIARVLGLTYQQAYHAAHRPKK